MLELHLYGKLRRYAASRDPRSESVLRVPFSAGDTVGSVVTRIGIPQPDLGSNVFVNGRYADLTTMLHDGDRLGLFPDDMQLLYKWYFAPQTPAPVPNQDSAAPASTRASETTAVEEE